MVFGSPSHLRTGINGKRAHPHSTEIAARTSLYEIEFAQATACHERQPCLIESCDPIAKSPQVFRVDYRIASIGSASPAYPGYLYRTTREQENCDIATCWISRPGNCFGVLVDTFHT